MDGFRCHLPRLTGAPHGGSVAACLTSILAFSYLAATEQFAAIAEALDPSVRELPLLDRAERCSQLVDRLLSAIDLQVRFSDFGMTEDDIDKATHIAMTGYYFDISCHPMKVTEEDIGRIYRECL